MSRLLWLGIVLCLLACEEKPLDLELPFEGPRIKVDGVLWEGRQAEVYLSRTTPPLDVTADNFFLDGAHAFLFLADGSLVDSLQFQGRRRQSSRYVSAGGYLPSRQEQYYLEISAPGMPSARSEALAWPAAAALDSAALIWDKAGDRVTEIFARFSDDPASDNYYQLVISAHYRTPLDTVLDVGSFIISNEDDFREGRVIFNRALGLSLKRSITIGEEELELKEPEYLLLSLLSYGPGSESYFETIEGLDEEIGGFFPGNPFAPTNFDGGYGFLHTAAVDTVLFR